MAVLAANVELPHLGNPTKVEVPTNAADVYYAGAIVWALAAGYASVAPAAGDRPIGICTRQFTTTAQGDKIEIFVDGTFLFPALSSVSIADLGSGVCFDVSANVTDNPADCVSVEDTTLAADDALVGRIVSFVGGRPYVNIATMGAIYAATWWKF